MGFFFFWLDKVMAQGKEANAHGLVYTFYHDEWYIYMLESIMAVEFFKADSLLIYCHQFGVSFLVAHQRGYHPPGCDSRSMSHHH